MLCKCIISFGGIKPWRNWYYPNIHNPLKGLFGRNKNNKLRYHFLIVLYSSLLFSWLGNSNKLNKDSRFISYKFICSMSEVEIKWIVQFYTDWLWTARVNCFSTWKAGNPSGLTRPRPPGRKGEGGSSFRSLALIFRRWRRRQKEGIRSGVSYCESEGPHPGHDGLLQGGDRPSLGDRGAEDGEGAGGHVGRVVHRHAGGTWSPFTH